MRPCLGGAIVPREAPPHRLVAMVARGILDPLLERGASRLGNVHQLEAHALPIVHID